MTRHQKCRRCAGAKDLIGARAISVTLFALVLGGCASTNKKCELEGQSSFNHNGETVRAPEGCRFTGDDNGPVRTFVCEDGREGMAIANVSSISAEIDE